MLRRAVSCVAMALVLVVVVLTSPILRSSPSDSERPPEGLRRNFALPASDSSRLTITAWVMREDAVVTVRSENDDDDEEKPCNAVQPLYDGYDASRSPSGSARARDLAVHGRVSALRPLRC